MKKTLLVTTAIAWALSGCAYSVKPHAMPPIDIYSSYDEKIPGTWLVLIDGDIKNISRQIRASSYVCSAHTYPIEPGDAIAAAASRTMRAIFENTTEDKGDPEINGTISVRLDTFDPRIRCSMGFFSGTCTASADVEFEVTVRDQNKKLFATSVGDSATVDGDSGAACEGGANTLSDAISKSVREALERMGERLSNAPRIRGA